MKDDNTESSTSSAPTSERMEWLADRIKEQHAIFDRKFPAENVSGDPGGHDSLNCTHRDHQGCHLYAFVTLALLELKAGAARRQPDEPLLAKLHALSESMDEKADEVDITTVDEQRTSDAYRECASAVLALETELLNLPVAPPGADLPDGEEPPQNIRAQVWRLMTADERAIWLNAPGADLRAALPWLKHWGTCALVASQGIVRAWKNGDEKRCTCGLAALLDAPKEKS